MEERKQRIYKWTAMGALVLIILMLVSLQSCVKDPILESPTSTSCGTPLELTLPNFFPPMSVPGENPLTVEGVFLGRNLFYEPMLSGDNSQTCADCHHQDLAFSDTVRFSKGIDGFVGTRNTMPLSNLGYGSKFFWDGRAPDLEHQPIFPIVSPVEMHEDIYHAVQELQASEHYRGLFYNAFCDSTVTVERLNFALAQFMRTIFSYNLKMAPGDVGRQSRNPIEERGFQVFIDEKKGDCFHCHAVNIFTTNFEFANNGTYDGTGDAGLGGQNGNPADLGKFKTPSLLNLIHTAPYMHDGRFKTLREVIDHYDTGFHVTPSTDPNLLKHTDGNGKPLARSWTEQDKQDLIFFLSRLTDDRLRSDSTLFNPHQ